MAFAYSGDVGIPSYKECEKFAHQSGVSFNVSSTISGNHVKDSFHYRGNAIDCASSAANMQALAAWLIQFSKYWLELIHSGGPGYFVKNGNVVSKSYFGSSVVNGHYDHVHFAATMSGINAASKLGGLPNISNAGLGGSSLVNGCLPSAATGLIVIGSIVGSGLWIIQQHL